jgi:hypothetical protein
MARIRRPALAVATATVALSTMLAATPAAAVSTSHATRYAHALAAVKLFKNNGFANVGLPARRAVWVKACYRGVCAHDRLRPDPVCDTSSGVCVGTALRAVRITSRLVVAATYY